MKKNILLIVVLAALSVVAYIVYSKNSSSTIKNQELAQFAIEDTASIDKIFIVDSQGKSVLLEKVAGERLWNLNRKYKARKDAIDLLMDTFKRIRIRGNLAPKAAENMVRVMSSSAKKVEIYQGGDEPSKIYYVGPATPDHVGTIMVLEIPGKGRSEEPLITHIEGFTGFLTPRFFTDESEWRYTGYYEFPNLEFKQVEVIDNYNPAQSFSIAYDGGNNISLKGGYQAATNQFTQTINNFDSLAVKDYLLLYKKVHFDSYNTYLKPEAIDSISKVLPAYFIRVTDNQGKTKELTIYLKRAVKRHLDDKGNIIPWDMDFHWARGENGEFALAQRFVFNPILIPIQAFTQQAQSAQKPT